MVSNALSQARTQLHNMSDCVRGVDWRLGLIGVDWRLDIRGMDWRLDEYADVVELNVENDDAEEIVTVETGLLCVGCAWLSIYTTIKMLLYTKVQQNNLLHIKIVATDLFPQ